MIRLIVLNNIFKNEHNPFRDVHFEKFIFSYKFPNNFINCVVKFNKLVSLIVLVWKDLFLDVHFHVEQKLKKKLTDSQIFTNHLSLLNWENKLEFCLFMNAVLQKLFNFKNLLCNFHHSKVVYFFGCFDGAPFQILS